MFEFLNKSDKQLLTESEVHTFRGSGPGGRKSDTTEYAVRIVHKPTGTKARASESRSQQKNRASALRRLRLNYALQNRDAVDPEKIGIPPSLKPYLENGLNIKTSNGYYPFLVKLVLDLLSAHDGRLSDTAETLHVSTSQLSRFLTGDVKLRDRANQIRSRHGHSDVK